VQPEPGTDTWQPLKAGRRYVGRVRDVRDGGNAPIGQSDLVLSAAPGSVHFRSLFGPGAQVVISTATTPNLRGVRTALSGGPILVREGKRQRIPPAEGDDYESSSMHERHPRSAIGWNEQFYFLVQVDGRQPGRSVGMTLRELSEYMVRLGCREGMNLDGGGSSTLWFDGQVRNQPCDGEERAVANALVLLQRGRSVSSAD
jgi:Phosphodiester glycosidase